MSSVEILDRSDFKEKMNDYLEINPAATAVLTIDAHRGHLDPEIATIPCDPEDAGRVTANLVELCSLARSLDMPVIHVVVKRRKIPGVGTEASTQPFFQASVATGQTITPGRSSRTMNHNLEGAPQVELMPGIYREGDYLIDNKKRKSVFYGTDLEILLRVLGVEALLIGGVNTNTCVLNAVFDCHNRDLFPVVVEECTASMYGQDMHLLGLENISRCLGWVLKLEQVKEKLL